MKDWAEEVQRREIARLQAQNLKLKKDIERAIGRPIQLTSEEQLRLTELSKGMDPDTLKEISVFGPEQFTAADIEKESAENP